MQSLMGETPKTALHRFLPGAPLGQLKLNWFGSVTSSGGELFEQIGVVNYEGQSCRCRRVVVQLARPTRDGETEIALLTNLSEKDAPSVLLAQLYRSRWRRETLFQVATQTFHIALPPEDWSDLGTMDLTQFS